MSPEERQLLSELFDRVRGQANAPRDRDAENFIADAVRAQPYAPYLLAQAVIVQEQALRAADQKIQELQAHVAQLEAPPQQQQSGGSGGFLGGLFGGGAAARPAAQPSPWGAQQSPPQYAPSAPPPQAAPSPWGAPQQPQSAPQGGGFLRNALGAAAGVAGGVMLADSIRGLFGGHNSGGLFGGQGLGGGLGNAGGGETVVNNFFDKPQDKAQDVSDLASDRDYTGLSDEDFGGDDYSGDDDYGADV